jgi:hypothetical protein
LEDGINQAKQQNRGFTADFFMLHIDKFFSKNMNVVIHPIDDEYERYLKKQEEDKKELQKTIEQLDDFFFQATEPDKNQDPRERDREADELLKRQSTKEGVDLFRQQLEEIVRNKQYKSEQELRQINKLLETLRAQVQSHVRASGGEQKANEQEKPKEDIHELRRRGMQEIFHFYSRQHIPQNRQFDDLKEIMNEVDLGEYMKFCKDFEVPLSKAKITEIFKKTSINHKPHKFEQFFSSTARLGREINNEKLYQIEQRLRDIQRINKSSSLPNSTRASALVGAHIPLSYLKQQTTSVHQSPRVDPEQEE